MKKFNATLIAGSLLVAGAVVTPAFAWGNDCNDNNNHHYSWNWRNRYNSNNNTSQYVDHYVRTNPYWNSYGNGTYNTYSNDYFNPHPGFFTRVINRIF